PRQQPRYPSPDFPTASTAAINRPMSLTPAIQQFSSARNYTLSLLTETDEADWYRLPPGCPTHLAWQIGHLAMAEYGLGLFRQRGRQEIDREIMPSDFRKGLRRRR